MVYFLHAISYLFLVLPIAEGAMKVGAAESEKGASSSGIPGPYPESHCQDWVNCLVCGSFSAPWGLGANLAYAWECAMT